MNIKTKLTKKEKKKKTNKKTKNRAIILTTIDYETKTNKRKKHYRPLEQRPN